MDRPRIPSIGAASLWSRTLAAAPTSRTRIERDFDTEEVRRLKATTEREIFVGVADLAAAAFKAGLIDECRLFLVPVLVGGGKRGLADNVRLELELLDERRFAGGVVYVRYRAR